ncbi:laminin subunit beta-2-like [Tenrec ecaudatus]|uniref:laminin subunit beta-2-like n=1 Tax=Tenrec ecaudatus TaxID=94439 RepID=UPI003F5975B6
MVQAPRTITQEAPDIQPPPSCSSGSCYPPTGSLVIGRHLQASSTCGLRGPEPYCVVSHLQDSESCFFCDSWTQQGHGIENVVSRTGLDGLKSWWQAESGVENVSIQLDLEGAFSFTHLILTFKTFRPAALLLERSADHGRSWRVYRYFAHNCTDLFPGIPLAPGHRVTDLVCDQRYSDIEPSTEGKVIFKVLDPAIPVEDPNSPEVQELLRVTNLRVNFSKLHTLGDRPLGGLKGHPFYYYAIYELVAQGSCLCHGHASECRPAPGAPVSVEGMVHGFCLCRHHTAGANCERCQDLHQDQPWRAAEPGQPHACQECECHGHAHSCHFDMALYLGSGNVSGGVCNACQHNTAGRHCHLCQPFFHRDSQEDPRSPRSCRPCDCDPVGALEGGLCDTHTDETQGLLSGQCRCKDGVWGPRCDSCRPGHYGLSPTQPAGCQPCRCDPRGRVPGGQACDPSSGACHCKRFVSGRDCSRCLPEFWGLSSDPPGCRPCDCDFGGAYSNRCSAREGLCQCRPHLRGRRCHELQSGHFCATLDQALTEAEFGEPLQPTDPRLPVPAEPLPWHQVANHAWGNGLKFARVVDGAGLFLLAPAVPRALEYDIILRYETQLVLLPRVEELPGLRSVDPGAAQRLQELHQGGCLEAARTGPPSTVPAACAHLVCSISALLHGGGLACECHPQGSLSTECALLGGQCPCRPHVIGRTCDRCEPGTYGFGPTGCSECHCHAEGATSTTCNPLSGQCTCRTGLAGRRCDRCRPGRWGFPRCQPCACNGHAELCHPLTGVCQACQGATTGRHCERCLDGYYGDPVLGSGQQCRPCPCPGYPASGLYYGSSCHVDSVSGRVLCLCAPGYAVGIASAVCTKAMALAVPTAGLASMAVPCARGAASVSCSCDSRGTVPTRCPAGAEACFCNQASGQCLCRPHTLGRDCNRCAPLFWNLGGFRGCHRPVPLPGRIWGPYMLSVCDPRMGACLCRDGISGLRRDVTTLTQTLKATEQTVADSRLRVRGQRERLEALSWELDCVKGLSRAKGALGTQDADAAALLSQEAMLRAQAVAAFGDPDSILVQAQQTRQWMEQLLGGTGQPTRATLWGLKLKGLVSLVQMLQLQLLGLSVRAGVVDEGADVTSVELVAWRVLAVPLPQGVAAGVGLLLDQIQGYHPSPDIAGQELPRAKGILHWAQQTRDSTAKAHDQVLDIQGALAEAAVYLNQVVLGTEVAPVLGHLSSAAKALKMHWALNQQQAQEADDQAARAMGVAGDLGKVKWGSEELQVTWLGVAELQEGTYDLVATVKEAGERVQRAQTEAQELLKQARSTWNRLEGLEHRLARNEQALGKKVATLQALEQRAAELLEYMLRSANTYATC